ncbi:formate dehydrogenase accessory sulfurtransferase FdhD [Aquabacterium sp. A7-Y]|uniref:formate dehydrogenase accessory sulfurtransferase FdhD n=1 Tax=Aquabacterium sp. A7-Y TaxID=1349605 RepID=UPI00223E16A5|nr:formate dehydrogenase accessory sulfurtransferase FdhD [Aquabacterium sp. A7-Y]MCW7539942.1 formate dehydrogenase accessory sulfurtransferase FdhD [Aquabacterium sp. A7-Y]
MTTSALPPPVGDRPVRRTQNGSSHPATDQLASEVPVALSFNGVSHAVMMATPADLEDFALGFALSEGLIASPAQCYGMELASGPLGCELRLEIASRAFDALKRRRRSLEGRTGCGLCGIESLAALDLQPEPLPAERALPGLGVTDVLQAFEQLSARQPLSALTGACHAAGWALPDGRLLEVAEDVGRHNALDKLIGRLARQGLLDQPGFVIVSSRASYELVRKCARLSLPALAAISAPTTLAVDIARQAGLRLFGFCRENGAVEY